MVTPVAATVTVIAMKPRRGVPMGGAMGLWNGVKVRCGRRVKVSRGVRILVTLLNEVGSTGGGHK